MKKVETHVYEVTPKEIRELPQTTQVLCYDLDLRYFSIIYAIKALSKLGFKTRRVKYFIFDLPEGFKGA